MLPVTFEGNLFPVSLLIDWEVILYHINCMMDSLVP